MKMPRPRPPRFDFAGAISRLDRQPTDDLRAKYPELEWLFAEYDVLLTAAEEFETVQEKLNSIRAAFGKVEQVVGELLEETPVMEIDE